MNPNSPINKALFKVGLELFAEQVKTGISDVFPEINAVKENFKKTKENVDKEAIAQELHGYIDKLKNSGKVDTIVTLAVLLRNFVSEIDKEALATTNHGEIVLSVKQIGGQEFTVYDLTNAGSAFADGKATILFDKGNPDAVDLLNQLDANPSVIVLLKDGEQQQAILMRFMDNNVGYTREADKHYIKLVTPKLTKQTDYTGFFE